MGVSRVDAIKRLKQGRSFQGQGGGVRALFGRVGGVGAVQTPNSRGVRQNTYGRVGQSSGDVGRRGQRTGAFRGLLGEATGDGANRGLYHSGVGGKYPLIQVEGN